MIGRGKLQKIYLIWLVILATTIMLAPFLLLFNEEELESENSKNKTKVEKAFMRGGDINALKQE